MKKNVMISALLILMSLMLSNKQTAAQELKSVETQVDVYYFHATRRCPTCEAIESETKKTLNDSFAEQMKTGEIKFHILNLDESVNKELVEKYEIYGSSLILIPAYGEEVRNLTNKAFMYALDQPYAFRKALKENLNELLK